MAGRKIETKKNEKALNNNVSSIRPFLNGFKVFDFILLMGVAFSSSSDSPWSSVSMVARISFMEAGSVQLSAVLL